MKRLLPILLTILLMIGSLPAFAGCSAKETAKDLRDLEWFDDFLAGRDETELTLDEYPGVLFRYTQEDQVTAKPEEGEETTFFEGLSVKNIFLSDLNGDGRREFCATFSVGSGIIHYWVTVYDYHAGEEYDLLGYDLSERSAYDYILELREGKLTAVKYQKESNDVKAQPLVAEGTLILEEQDGKTMLWMKEA